MNFLKSMFGFIAGLLFPEPQRCAICGRIMKDNRELWCGSCVYLPCKELEYNRRAHKFAGAVSGAIYSEDMKSAIWRIKRTPDKRTLQYLAILMERSLKEYQSDITYDVIVPVPINKERLKERGFNQSEKLAEALSEIIQAPVEAHALIRHDDSEIQHTLDKRSRFANAAKSYAATGGNMVKAKTVLLVDDLYTTGATASACTDRLLEMGANSVYVATAAATPLKWANAPER